MTALTFIFSLLYVTVCLSPLVQSAVLKNDLNPITKTNFEIGSIQPEDRLIFNHRVIVGAKPGEAVTEDVFFFGFGALVNYVSAVEIEGSQGGTVVLIAGALGEDTIGLRLTSAVDYGLKYLVNIYGN